MLGEHFGALFRQIGRTAAVVVAQNAHQHLDAPVAQRLDVFILVLEQGRDVVVIVHVGFAALRIPVDVAREEHDGIEEQLAVLQHIFQRVERVGVVHLEIEEVLDRFRALLPDGEVHAGGVGFHGDVGRLGHGLQGSHVGLGGGEGRIRRERDLDRAARGAGGDRQNAVVGDGDARFGECDELGFVEVVVLGDISLVEVDLDPGLCLGGFLQFEREGLFDRFRLLEGEHVGQRILGLQRTSDLLGRFGIGRSGLLRHGDLHRLLLGGDDDLAHMGFARVILGVDRQLVALLRSGHPLLREGVGPLGSVGRNGQHDGFVALGLESDGIRRRYAQNDFTDFERFLKHVDLDRLGVSCRNRDASGTLRFRRIGFGVHGQLVAVLLDRDPVGFLDTPFIGIGDDGQDYVLVSVGLERNVGRRRNFQFIYAVRVVRVVAGDECPGDGEHPCKKHQK